MPPNPGGILSVCSSPQFWQRITTWLARGRVRAALITMPGTRMSLFISAAVTSRMSVGAISPLKRIWIAGATSVSSISVCKASRAPSSMRARTSFGFATTAS